MGIIRSHKEITWKILGNHRKIMGQLLIDDIMKNINRSHYWFLLPLDHSTWVCIGFDEYELIHAFRHPFREPSESLPDSFSGNMTGSLAGKQDRSVLDVENVDEMLLESRIALEIKLVEIKLVMIANENHWEIIGNHRNEYWKISVIVGPFVW